MSVVLLVLVCLIIVIVWLGFILKFMFCSIGLFFIYLKFILLNVIWFLVIFEFLLFKIFWVLLFWLSI